MIRSCKKLRTGSVAIVALVLLIVIATPTVASALFFSLQFRDQTGRYLMMVSPSPTGEFQITYSALRPVLLCSGVGAQLTMSKNSLVLTIQSYPRPGSPSYVRCQSGIYPYVQASGTISMFRPGQFDSGPAGIITVVLVGASASGSYPPMLVLSMSLQTEA